MQQKLFQRQEELRHKQDEIEEEEKAILRQPSDSKKEQLQHLHQHLVNPAYEMASPAPSPTHQQGLILLGNYANFSYQPQFPSVSLPQVIHQPINLQPVNLQRSMHPLKYRRERPPPQSVQVEEQPQSLRQRPYDGAAAVPQPVTTQSQAVATPSQV
uniref:Uncharacterized protein n=1 Tax=Panagrolaimus davidi TaxID=227884 RepID=A0A914Q6S3_9BILA